MASSRPSSPDARPIHLCHIPHDTHIPMSKLVVITGASSGLGQALALRFYQAGYRLALVARRVAEIESWANANQIDAAGYQIYTADVSNANAMVAMGNA